MLSILAISLADTRPASAQADTTPPTVTVVSPAHKLSTRTQATRLRADVTDSDSGVDDGTIAFNIVSPGGIGTGAPITIPITGGFRAEAVLTGVALGETEILWNVTASDKAGNVGQSDSDPETEALDDHALRVDTVQPQLASPIGAITGQYWTGSAIETDPDKALNTSIRLIFNEDMDGASIQATDFTVDGVAPAAAEWFSGAPESVFLTVPAMAPDATPAIELVGTIGDRAGNQRSSGISTVAIDGIGSPTDITPPVAPTGLAATAGNLEVLLDWNDNAEADLDGYKVFRSTTPGGPYTKVSAALLASSAYADTGLTNGTTYYYVVTTVDMAGNESANSGEVSATPLAFTPPAAPTGIVVFLGNQEVLLDWNDNAEADLDGYKVFRSTTSGGPYTKVSAALLASSAYTDTGLTNGTTYYYVLTAVDTAGDESPFSNEASATPTAVDMTPPMVTVISPAHKAATRVQSTRLIAEVTDIYSGVEAGTIAFNIVSAGLVSTGAPVTTAITGGFRVEAVLTGVALGETEILWNVTASDKAGNLGQSDSDLETEALDDHALRVDTLAPGYASPIAAVTGHYYYDGLKDDPTGAKNTSIRVIFNEELDGASIQSTDFTVDGVAPVAAEWFSGEPTSVFLTVPAMASNAHPKVKVVNTIADAAGNTVSSLAENTAVDGIAPALALSIALSDDTLTIEVATDEPLLTVPTVTVNGSTVGLTSFGLVGPNLFRFTFGPAQVPNTYNVEVTTTDTSGNRTSDAVLFNTAPTPAPTPTPIPALAHWALIGLAIALASLLTRRLRQAMRSGGA